MRIVKEWNEKEIKVTMFHMNGRYSLKLEHELLEQTYKFRDGVFQNPDQLLTELPDNFYDNAMQLFSSMAENRNGIKFQDDEREEFDIII